MVKKAKPGGATISTRNTFTPAIRVGAHRKTTAVLYGKPA